MTAKQHENLNRVIDNLAIRGGVDFRDSILISAALNLLTDILLDESNLSEIRSVLINEYGSNLMSTIERYMGPAE